jgi:uncharacterized protein YjbI with pentapeptide repeats
VSFTVAVIGLAGLAWLAWVLLGLGGYRHHGAPALKDTVGVLQLVFATVAGAGALVALIVAYRRQKVAEADSVHDRTRVFNERFTTIAAQLGDAQPAVRLAGVHAMAGLADDWKQNRQTCVDVLCAYLRLPYDPDQGNDADRAERTAFRANREVRHTVIRLIGAHLRPGAAMSWQGLDFDFTGVVFDGGDFADARFSGGTVGFNGAEFADGLVSFGGAEFADGAVDFRDARFSGRAVHFGGARFSGSWVDFRGAVFSGGTVGFPAAEFSGGTVDFSRAKFSGGEVRFRGAEFSGSTVDFKDAGFSGGLVRFTLAGFSGSTVSFHAAGFSGGEVRFDAARFSRGRVHFDYAEFSGGTVDFGPAEYSGGFSGGAGFSGGVVNFWNARFSGGQVDFSSARDWSRPPIFSGGGKPPAGVVLPV